jgi:hypothetical protein
MSWLFSQALVAEYLEANSSAGAPCAQLNVMLTRRRFWRRDRMMGYLSHFPSGPTLQHLTVIRGRALLRWFLEVSRARTSALLAKERESLVAVQDCGKSSFGSFARFDRDTSSWKTPQLLLLGGLKPFSATWPNCGSMRNGECWERPMLEHHTNGEGYGLWQTPVADDAYNRKLGKFNSRGEPKLSAQMKLWPTPTKSDACGGPGCSGRDGGMNLRTAVTIPTPTVHGNYNQVGVSKNSGTGLATFVSMFPTPTKRDHKGGADWSKRKRNGKPRKDSDKTLPDLVEQDGGQLNPRFVEWMMGWPYDHTRLDRRWTSFSREEITIDCLRTLWDDEQFASSPQGQKFIEQLARQHPDLVRELSHGLALGRGQTGMESLSTVLRGLWKACNSWPLRNAQESFQAAWKCATCETKGWFAMASIRGIWHAEWPGVPRTETGITARVDRLAALGNGQVPLCASEAFRQLHERLNP